MTDLTFLAIARGDTGALALTHRPKLRALAAFVAAGATHVVTLLSEREGASQLGLAVRAAGMRWMWLPLANGDPPKRASPASELVSRISHVIDTGGRVVVHCSAGIHRTGMIGYAVLRHRGLDPQAARATLRALREVTAAGVGAERMAWGDRLAGIARDERSLEGQNVVHERSRA